MNKLNFREIVCASQLFPYSLKVVKEKGDLLPRVLGTLLKLDKMSDFLLVLEANTAGSNIPYRKLGGSVHACVSREGNKRQSRILVPRAYDPFGLWLGSRALVWSNTGSP